jgi:penicillin-binding protein 2
MLVIDELKKNDPQLRLVAVMLAAGLFILLAGLWWVQIVSSRQYQSHFETQAYRTIRLPAMRGRILDHEGRVLAENQPSYNLNLYLDDLSKRFSDATDALMKQAKTARIQAIAAREKKLGRSLTKAELKQYAFKPEFLEQIRSQARTEVAANVVTQISKDMDMPLPFDAAKFDRHYKRQLAMPYTIQSSLDGQKIARFEENYTTKLGADLELQSTRYYPNGSLAAHILGYLRKDDDSAEGEFNYRLPDYRGVTGIEAGYNSELRGTAGEESVVVNNQGYRQSEDVESEPEPGHNVTLTLDMDIQRAAEQSIVSHQGAGAHAAVVVMDVHTGDVLALVSSPTFDPNDFVNGISQEKYQEMQELTSEKNRATYEIYAPGSIFKPIVGLVALENGLDPRATIFVAPSPRDPHHGYVLVGNQQFQDTVPPGDYDFRHAIERSSNAYFITIGMRVGIQKIVEMGKRLHLGERMNLPTRQESAGYFPDLKRVTKSDWRDGDSANICFGQGEMAITPMQMTIAYCALANGGKVLYPRLVDRIESQDSVPDEMDTNFPAGVVRDELRVHPRSLNILYDAMLSETEDAEGTGKQAVVPGLRICGKTGTAQVKDEHGHLTGWDYWFASFAPYENPRYAVIVMVQSDHGGSGGSVCAPIAHDVYEVITKKQNTGTPKILASVN